MSLEIKDSQNPLGKASVEKLMIKFAIPSIIGMLVSAMYNMIDQLFIGRYVGILGNGATNIAFPFTTVCMAIALLFGIGGASYFNLTLGMGNKKKTPFIVGNALTMLVGLGIIISALTLLFMTPLLRMFGSSDEILPYAKDYVFVSAFGFPFLILTTGGGHLMRADGSPRITMVCNITGALINIVLDAIFVIVLGFGMKGAALATVIGQFISAMIVVVYCLNFKTVKLELQHLIPEVKIVKRISEIGIASCFNQLAITLVQIILNNSLKNYGALSVYGDSEPIACAGIVMKVNMIVFSIVIGLAQGTQPIESFNYGAKNYKRVKDAYLIALKCGFSISIIAFIFFQVFPKQILSFFGEGTDTYFEFGVKFFRIFLFFTWLNCIQPITATFFTSIGKSFKGMFLSLTRQIIFFIPLLLILPKIFKINGILFTGPIADLLAGLVAIGMAIYEFKDMKRLEKSHF